MSDTTSSVGSYTYFTWMTILFIVIIFAGIRFIERKSKNNVEPKQIIRESTMVGFASMIVLLIQKQFHVDEIIGTGGEKTPHVFTDEPAF